jgi:hypothetical protein
MIMKISNCFHSLILLALASSLPLSGCANLSPTENGLGAGAIAGPLAYGILRAAGVNNDIALPIAGGLAVAAGAGTYLYAHHQATLQQKKIAETRAKHLYSKMNETEKAKVKKIAVVTQGSDSTKGVPIIMVNPKTGEAGVTVYDYKEMPNLGQPIKSTDVATAFN